MTISKSWRTTRLAANFRDKAVEYLKDAGDTAVSRSSFRNAVHHFEHALEALRHLPNAPDNVRRGIDLRIEIRSALSCVRATSERGFDFLKEGSRGSEGARRSRAVRQVVHMHDRPLESRWQLRTSCGRPGKQALKYIVGQSNIDSNIVAHNWLGVISTTIWANLSRQLTNLIRRFRLYQRLGTLIFLALTE